MRKTLFISEKQVTESLQIEDSISLAREAYVRLAKHQALSPERAVLSNPKGASIFAMPAHVTGHKTSSVKIARLSPKNPEKDLPSVMATVYVYDSVTGMELAHIEAEAFTALRTAASTAVATDLLAATDCETLGIFGTGKQARAHVPALLAVRNFSQILVYSPNPGHRSRFAKEISGKFHLPTEPVNSPRKVAENSEVLVLATNSSTPIFNGRLVRPRALVNVVGASLPQAREVDTYLVRNSFLVVDSLAQAKSTYGDVLIPLEEGAIIESDIKELGNILVNPKKLPRNRTQTRLFKSGGVAVLDAMFAEHLVSQNF